MELPQHPARQAQQEQQANSSGLIPVEANYSSADLPYGGAINTPQQEQQVDPRGSANPYYRSNPALDAAGAQAATMNAQKQVGLEQAQAAQAYAHADKLAAENAVLQQAGGLGNPQVDPVQQLAEELASGQVDVASLQGQVPPEVINEAMTLASAMQPQQGLGGLA